jgi:MacB-like periplasmic core domain
VLGVLICKVRARPRTGVLGIFSRPCGTGCISLRHPALPRISCTRLWTDLRTRLSSRKAARGSVGKPIQIVHKTYTILGVLPPRFTFLDGDVYLPLNPSTSQTITYGTFIKLKPGITRAAAAAELEPLFQQFAKQTPNHFPKQYKLEVRTLSYYYMHQLGGTLALLFGAVGLLLAIGCGNVSILLLARGTARQHEFGVRSAVGANAVKITITCWAIRLS